MWRTLLESLFHHSQILFKRVPLSVNQFFSQFFLQLKELQLLTVFESLAFRLIGRIQSVLLLNKHAENTWRCTAMQTARSKSTTEAIKINIKFFCIAAASGNTRYDHPHSTDELILPAAESTCCEVQRVVTQPNHTMKRRSTALEPDSQL